MTNAEYNRDVKHSARKRGTNDSHKVHLPTLTLIFMAFMVPKVNVYGIKSIFRFICRISEIGVQEISKSENLEPEIAVFEKAENGNLSARKLSATEI